MKIVAPNGKTYSDEQIAESNKLSIEDARLFMRNLAKLKKGWFIDGEPLHLTEAQGVEILNRQKAALLSKEDELNAREAALAEREKALSPVDAPSEDLEVKEEKKRSKPKTEI